MKELGMKYNTDKVTYHAYHEVYESYVKEFYESEGCMVEIGLQEGNSLNMWLEMFPKAYIYGMDLDKGYRGPRHFTLRGDQSQEKDVERLKDVITTSVKSKDLFLICDDGSHIPEHQLLTFNILFPLLRDGGIYIIEDIETSYWTKGNCYQYPTRYGLGHPNSIVEIFKKAVDPSVNSGFSGASSDNNVKHLDYIRTITFGYNCILITKNTKPRQKRPYPYPQFL